MILLHPFFASLSLWFIHSLWFEFHLFALYSFLLHDSMTFLDLFCPSPTYLCTMPCMNSVYGCFAFAPLVSFGSFLVLGFLKTFSKHVLPSWGSYSLRQIHPDRCPRFRGRILFTKWKAFRWVWDWFAQLSDDVVLDPKSLTYVHQILVLAHGSIVVFCLEPTTMAN